jgi:transposase
VRHQSITRFIGIPEHRPMALYFLDRKGRSTEVDAKVAEVIVELARTGRAFHCECGRSFARYYDHQERLVRDLRWGPWKRVRLLVPRFRVDCPDCGVKTEPLRWIPARCHYTRRLADAVALACREVRTIDAIAESFGLHWETVRDIDKAALKARLNPPNLLGVRHLALDEFSIRRRHTYGTIFLDAERTRVLWVCETREKKAVIDVFRNVFGPDVCRGIEAVSIDCWDAYEAAVHECLPNAQVVWDRYHMISNYNLKVVDRVRIDEARRCQSKEERETLRKAKFILLKNRRNLVNDEPAELRELLAANRRLLTVHVLGDGLKELWEYRYPAAAAKWFEGWYRRAIHSRIEPLKRFARMLRERLDGVLAHCRYPIHTGTLEGVNNTVKVIKRVAYGFRDLEYFFLKIRAHFSEIHPH